jgi:hypothetical protein
MSGLVGVNSAGAATAVKEVNIAINDVFIPEVIESNADAKVILSGMLPNSCYKWSRAVVVNLDEMNHEIKARAYVTTDTMCLMVLIPFSKELNLGHLRAGEHTMRFIGWNGTYFERKVVVQ